MTDETRNTTPPATASHERDDQTTAKQAESLRTSEIRYRRLFEAAREGFLILDADSRRITDVNPYMVELLEYSREELIGKELYEIGLLADEAASQKVYRALQESGYVRYEDLPLETKSGRRWEVEVVCNIYDEDGQQVIQCNIRDITARRQADAAKSLLASIVDSVDVSVVSIDFDRTITSWNPGAEALYGYTEAEAIGQSLTMLMLPEDLHELLNNIERIKQHQPVETFETVRVQKNGEHLHLSITLSPVKDAAGHVIGVSRLARDISKQKHAEAALRNSERRYRLLVENAPDIISRFDRELRHLFVSPAIERLVGIAPAAFLGKTHREMGLSEELIAHWDDNLRSAFETGQSYNEEFEFPGVDGRILHFESRAIPEFGEDGMVETVFSIARDITEQKQAEVALRESAAQLQLVTEVIPQQVWTAQADGALDYANQRALDYFEQSSEEPIGWGWLDMVHPDDVPETLARWTRALETGELYETEFRLKRASDNTYRWNLSRALPLCDDQDRITKWFGTNTDITDLKEAEAALQQKSHELTDFFENAAVGLQWVGADGTVIWANQAEFDLLGFTREEYIGHNVTDFYADPAVISNILQQLANHETLRAYEAQIRCKDGSLKDVQVTSNALFEDGKFIHSRCFTRDITAQKQAEAALRESELHFRLLVEGTKDYAMFLMDTERKIVHWNSGAERIIGYDKSEALGQIADIIFTPEERERGVPEQEMRTAMQNGRAGDNRWHIRKDGTRFWANGVMAAIHDENGQLSGFAKIMRDATRKKQVEEALEAAKAEAERANHAKSEFLSRMSHELRTPMNAILGFGQLLEMDDLNAEQRQGVEQILKGGRHLLELINEVLDVARIEAGEMSISLEAVQLGMAVQEALDLVRPLAAQRDVELPGDWDADCGHTVLADQQRLKQVVINLLSNSIKYNREGGSVAVSCEVRETDALRITITDTGPGIAPDDLEKLFVPFERLGAERSETEGTGIGLALSKRLMELMGGTIGVQSTPSVGSTFWIELPLAESSDLPAPDAHGDASEDLSTDGQHATRTILYIEDNLSNLRLVESILIRQPQTKLVAAMQGGLGLELAREHQPDLILLDLHLPDIQGNEVLRRLRAEAATREIPVIMLSADATPGQIERLLQAGASAYLTKPLDVKRFIQVLEETLAKRKQ